MYRLYISSSIYFSESEVIQTPNISHWQYLGETVDHQLQHKPTTGTRGWQVSCHADMIWWAAAEQIGRDVGQWQISLQGKWSRKSEAQVFGGIQSPHILNISHTAAAADTRLLLAAAEEEASWWARMISPPYLLPFEQKIMRRRIWRCSASSDKQLPLWQRQLIISNITLTSLSPFVHLIQALNDMDPWYISELLSFHSQILLLLLLRSSELPIPRSRLRAIEVFLLQRNMCVLKLLNVLKLFLFTFF